MAWSFLQATKQARADLITTQIGAGGHLGVWSAAYANLLVEWTFTANMFAAATAVPQPQLVMNQPTPNPMVPALSGTAALARISNAARTSYIVSDMTVGTTGTDVIISNIAISTSTPVSLNSMTITEAL